MTRKGAGNYILLVLLLFLIFSTHTPITPVIMIERNLYFMDWIVYVAFLLGIVVGTAYVIFVRYPKYGGHIYLHEDEEKEQSPKIILRICITPEELESSKYVMFEVERNNYNGFNGKEV